VTKGLPSRRQFVATAAAGAVATALPRPLRAQGGQPRIVVVGGGFGGATTARFLKRADPRLDVTLVEPNPIFTSCPFSNEVIAGLRDIKAQYFGYVRWRRHCAPDRDRRRPSCPHSCARQRDEP
jgi:sulfide dehydrogenase [flavocytochrome c] flavoprotein chain